MKIREGAYYRTRGGDVVGPMWRDAPSSIYPWHSVTNRWASDGMYSRGGETQHDLISEVYVSDTPPAVKDTEAELRDMMRDPRYWRTREPEFVKRVIEGFRALGGGDTPPADAFTLPSAMLKPQEWRRLKPIEPSPEAKTLRDEFAMTALTGLLANAVDDGSMGAEDWASDAYLFADKMMEARKKCP
jgi:hypothetical protein